LKSWRRRKAKRVDVLKRRQESGADVFARGYYGAGEGVVVTKTNKEIANAKTVEKRPASCCSAKKKRTIQGKKRETRGKKKKD